MVEKKECSPGSTTGLNCVGRIMIMRRPGCSMQGEMHSQTFDDPNVVYSII